MSRPEISTLLLTKAPLPAWAKDPFGRYLFVNDAWLSLCRLSPEQVLGRTDREVFEPEFAEAFEQNDQEVLQSGRTIHTVERVRSEAELRIGHSTKFLLTDPQGEAVAVGGIAVDITERYLAEKKLEASEKKYRDLIEHSPEAYFIFDTTSARFVETNENTEQLFGLSRDQLLRSSPGMLSPALQPDGRESHAAAAAYIEAALQGDSPVFEWLHQAGNGELLPCRIWLARVDLPEGPGVRASLLDLREVERVRSTLEQTRAQLDAIQDALPQMVVVYDPRSKAMSHCNKTYLNQELESSLWDLASEACAQCERADTARQEVSTRTKSGTPVTLEIEVSVFVRDSEGRARNLLLVGTDVTEQRKKDAIVRETQRLESLGRLAGGVAHDFNNLLTVILGSAELLESAIVNQPQAQVDLAALTDAASRAQALTSQLLTFARSHRSPEASVCLDEGIEASRGLLTRLLGEDVELHTQLGAAEVAVGISGGQLEQVLVNLLANSRDAMAAHGQVSICTREVEGSQLRFLSPSALRRFVELSVSDTGSGMTEEVLENAVDPFFSTKEVGRGTGLGLSTVHGIVQHAGGQVSFDSKPGFGTKVLIRLPVIEREAPSGRMQPSGPTRGDTAIVARVLLVEDEQSVREVNARGLKRAGHEVIAAKDAPSALSILKGEQVIDVVVTDVVMPQMSGFELADRAHQLRPGLPFIFVSGYAEAALKDRGLSRSQVELLQKPFSPQVLSDHVCMAVSKG